MTFRVYNETVDGFLDGTMEVEDVDAALALAAALAGSECFSFRPSTREERKEFTAVALQVGRLFDPRWAGIADKASHSWGQGWKLGILLRPMVRLGDLHPL